MRVMVLVIDSFGIGAMKDVPKVRPADIGANAALHVLERMAPGGLPNLERLGLANAAFDSADPAAGSLGALRPAPGAVYGSSELAHFWADTYWGHQEILGTKPKRPEPAPFSTSIDRVEAALKRSGRRVERREREGLQFLLVDGSATVADNIEADPGCAYNVTASLDALPFAEVVKIGKTVRSAVKVDRVIAFGGEGVGIERILGAAEIKEGRFLGINAPGSGVYDKGYLVTHLGYGVDPSVQAPAHLARVGVPTVLVGKVADICDAGELGEKVFGVESEGLIDATVERLARFERGFLCLNIQETDLAGHREDPVWYADRLGAVDRGLSRILPLMRGDDLLIVTADHGNDPTIGHPRHTRERVPLMVYGRGLSSFTIGKRKTLSDIGATVCDLFGAPRPEAGTSFAGLLMKR